MSDRPKIIEIDGSQIVDWESFHDVFAKAFGFPDFYGRNLDAWFDCMSSLDEDFNKTHIQSGETLTLQIKNANALEISNPEILHIIFKLTASVNFRRVEDGEQPILFVSANF